MSIHMRNEGFTAELTMLPVCECGHVFTELSYNHIYKNFSPNICPNCQRWITSLTIRDYSKSRPDCFGDICICDK